MPAVTRNALLLVAAAAACVLAILLLLWHDREDRSGRSNPKPLPHAGAQRTKRTTTPIPATVAPFVHVVCERDKRPIAEALCELSRDGTVQFSARTDERGVVRLPPLPVGTVMNLTIAAPNYLGYHEEIVASESQVEASLTPERRLVGRVVDDAGAPIPDARVVAKGETIVDTTTDQTGGFAFAPPPLDLQEVFAQKLGYEPARRPVGPSDDQPVTVTLAKVEEALISVHIPALTDSPSSLHGSLTLSRESRLFHSSPLILQRGFSLVRTRFAGDGDIAAAFGIGHETFTAKGAVQTLPSGEHVGSVYFEGFEVARFVCAREGVPLALEYVRIATPSGQAIDATTDDHGIIALPLSKETSRLEFQALRGYARWSGAMQRGTQETLVFRDYGTRLLIRATSAAEIRRDFTVVEERFGNVVPLLTESARGLAGPIPPGRYSVAYRGVPVDGFTIELTDSSEFVIDAERYSAAAFIIGRVSASARVRLYRLGARAPVEVTPCRVRPDGSFQSDLLPPGEYLVSAQLAARGPTVFRRCVLDGSGTYDCGSLVCDAKDVVSVRFDSGALRSQAIRVSPLPSHGFPRSRYPPGDPVDLWLPEQASVYVGVDWAFGIVNLPSRLHALTLRTPARDAANTVTVSADFGAVDQVIWRWVDQESGAVWFIELAPSGPSRFGLPRCGGDQYFVVTTRTDLQFTHVRTNPGEDIVLSPAKTRAIPAPTAPPTATTYKLRVRRFGGAEVEQLELRSARHQLGAEVVLPIIPETSFVLDYFDAKDQFIASVGVDE